MFVCRGRRRSIIGACRTPGNTHGTWVRCQSAGACDMRLERLESISEQLLGIGRSLDETSSNEVPPTCRSMHPRWTYSLL
jgi:hypothetical protein